MDNAQIADRLAALAALLELAEANPYTVRAYRRAAETVRAAPVPVADLVRAGRARDLRGIGPGIEARLRELVDTGAIAELTDLERELAPDLVGLGRFLGLSARRSVEIAQALGVRTAADFLNAQLPGGSVPRPESEQRPRRSCWMRSRMRTRRGRGAGCCSTAPASSSAGSRKRSARRSRATSGAGGTRASTWPWCAPARIPARARAGSPGWPRSWRWSRSATTAPSA
jgi:DNA polymerase/3'-5' exonuclease PolX